MLPYFTPAALGPTWPLLLCVALFMTATTVFLLFTRRRANHAPSETRFLQRLFDATEMFGMIALFTGVLGTCLHLIEILPELNRVLHDRSAQLAPEIALRLRTMWASAIAGLVLGGLWGEGLRFALKPRLRAAPVFIIKRATKRAPPKPKSTTNTPPEPTLDDLWQAKDAQSMY